VSANVGDRIRLHSNTVDTPDRVGTIVAVLGEDGPPYRVRFDAGEETIVAPGPDALIEPPGLGEKVTRAAGEAVEKVGEVAQGTAEAATQTAQTVAGTAAHVVSQAADAVRKRFDH
jgi:hypothetical protein